MIQTECGIYCSISKRPVPIHNVINGLHKLQHRGRDSFGISYLNQGSNHLNPFSIIKKVGVIDTFDDDFKKDSLSFSWLGHVRYSTSGSKDKSSILELTVEDIDYAFNNILKSTIYGTKNAAAAMKKNSDGGSIINIGSFAGIMAQKNASLYACFKAAIISFTKSAAAELAEYNIRVNCVTPGVISTAMTDDYINDNYQNLIQQISLKKIGTTEEVANGVVFLSSDYASYITGENLCITGGKYLIQR